MRCGAFARLAKKMHTLWLARSSTCCRMICRSKMNNFSNSSHNRKKSIVEYKIETDDGAIDTDDVQMNDASGNLEHQPFPQLRYCNSLRAYPALKQPFPAFRILNPDGSLFGKNQKTKSDKAALMNDPEKVVKIYKEMIKLNVLDGILYNSQRQGRISFYMTSSGEEGCVIASAAALSPQDIIYGQYREAGALLYRGYSLKDLMNQVFSNHLDDARGRQMPVHYGSKELNYFTISSPLGTQIPQASGAAYQLKRLDKDKEMKDKRIVLCYFGDGAASEGDFHAALNFAATLECPVLFFCRNNGYAISTPIVDQYRGDGIASRGPGYGIETFRVDGNDVFAVAEAVSQARKYVLENSKPALIEAMTYRLGHHSTSDDSSIYREKSEIELWSNEKGPFVRLHKYLINEKVISEEEAASFRKELQGEIMKEFAAAEKEKKPEIKHLFTDVYSEELPHLVEQREELQELIQKYPQDFDFLRDHKSG